MKRQNTKEIEERKIIWTALSEFYIDTELNDDDLARLSKIFYNSKLDLNTIKEIDLYEVFPLLKWNLYTPAPSWSGFDQPWLNDNCERMYNRRNNWLHRIICKAWNKTLSVANRSRYWDKIELLINKKL